MELLKSKLHQRTGAKKAPASVERRNGVLPNEGVVSSFWPRFLLLVGFSLLLGALATPHYMVLSVHYQVGNVADHDIKAARDFLVIDEAATQRKRMAAADKSLAVYDLDEEAVQHLRQRFGTILADMRALYQQPAETGTGTEATRGESVLGIHKSPKQLALEQKKEFETKLGITVSEADYAVLMQEKFDLRFEDAVVELADSVLASGVVGNKSLLLSEVQKGVVLRSVQSGAEEQVRDLLSFLSIEDARRRILLRASALLEDEDRRVRIGVVHLAQGLLQPNITFNRNETELRRQNAVEAVKPVFFQVKKGEMIVREGQRLGEEQVLKLQTQAEGKFERGVIFTILGTSLLGGLLIWLAIHVAGKYIRQFPINTKDLLFLAVVLGILLILAKISGGVAEAMNNAFPFISNAAIFYVLPMAAGAMLVTIFFGPTTGIVCAFFLALLAALVLDRQINLLFYYLVGSLVAVQGVAVCRDRSTPLRAGLAVGLANVSVILFMTLAYGRVLTPQTGVAILFGLVGGVLSGVVTTGLCPLAEMAFHYTTDVKLLELASMDRPLLRELMVQVPGTYHHSLIVGNMVEAAAKSIGANSLLARVAAYYHDIGKIKKPLYFVENQVGSENKHERLAPSMSSLILTSHVKDGVDLAKQHGLGQDIQDIIQQHHGTSVISFFYQKALDLQDRLRSSKGGEVSPVLVEDYRYPGPKPQTKEAGLVLLADAVEAACRTLAEPTVARIQGLVQKIINKIFSDGQLDECELTLKDLHQIAKSFIQILMGISHQRVEYPEPAAKGFEGKARANGDTGYRSAKRDRDGAREDRDEGEEDLKRLGMS
ncbi:MAG: HDIG domain-containing protein [Deltaproteobacteria bacterium]|nr:MAG: HDIG domain-containing protein [Deltaproteobacteria bacterium]